MVSSPVGDIKKYCPQLVLFMLNTLTHWQIECIFFQPYIFAIFTAPALKDTGLPIPKISAVSPSTRKFWDISRLCPSSVCKESSVWWPGASEFCYQASVHSVCNLSDTQMMFLRNSNNRRTVKSILLIRKLLGLVNASFSSPKWQAVKMIFFAPCPISHCFSGSFCEYRSTDYVIQ